MCCGKFNCWVSWQCPRFAIRKTAQSCRDWVCFFSDTQGTETSIYCVHLKIVNINLKLFAISKHLLIAVLIVVLKHGLLSLLSTFVSFQVLVWILTIGYPQHVSMRWLPSSLRWHLLHMRNWHHCHVRSCLLSRSHSWSTFSTLSRRARYSKFWTSTTVTGFTGAQTQ